MSQKIITSDKIYLSKSKISKAGRGVFAKHSIKKGKNIEKCPVIEISEYDMANINESILLTYFFFYGRKKEQAYIALGYGSMYNHSNQPNAFYKINRKEKSIDFFALKDISKGEEIKFDYKQGNPNSKDPLWFE